VLQSAGSFLSRDRKGAILMNFRQGFSPAASTDINWKSFSCTQALFWEAGENPARPQPL